MKGKFIQNGVHLAEHEWNTIELLLNLGYNIELVKPSDIKDMHQPDIIVDNVYWEIKSPKGGAKNTIRHNLKRAEKQSKNVIIDLRRCGFTDEQAIREIKRIFSISKRIKKIKIITKSENVLDFSK